MSRSPLAFAAIAVVVLLTLSCGEDDAVAPGDTTPPTVASSTPAVGGTDVGLVPLIEVEFSEAMNAATIGDTTFSLATSAATAAPTLTVSYDASGHRALCYPDSTLAADATYTLTCSGAVTDVAGNAMGSPWSASFTTGPADCAHLTDRFEENDTLDVAVAVDRDTWYRTLTNCDEDSDFYRFTVDDTAKVRFECLMRHVDDATWYTEFFREGGDSYVWSSSGVVSGETEVRSFTFYPGTYYIKMVAFRASNLLYDFAWSMETPCEDDAYEDNDFIDEAAPISPGTYEGLRGCFVDRDWYAVDAASGQTLTVTATSDYTGNRRMRISDPDGNQIAFYNGRDEPSMVQAELTRTGTHYVMMRVWSDGVVYDLSVELAN